MIIAVPATITKAESDAREILMSAWRRDEIPIPFPVDPFEIAKNLGIKAYTANLDPGVSGMLIKAAGEDPEIYVEASDSPNRRRFTCAHEIGHYVKRSATGDTEWEYIEHRDLLTSAGNNPEEIYANQFAASLLMPQEEVERRIKDREDLAAETAVLAAEFGVSEDAMRYRLVNLGLLR
jgi:Zn-dependent peptidase ImmA (M78 family)